MLWLTSFWQLWWCQCQAVLDSTFLLDNISGMERGDLLHGQPLISKLYPSLHPREGTPASPHCIRKQLSTDRRILKALLYGELAASKGAWGWPHNMRAIDIEWSEDITNDCSFTESWSEERRNGGLCQGDAYRKLRLSLSCGPVQP